ncbi:MAG: LysM peptidoglycan-binding domain-containing protein [Deltaproteobacteria bacterium]|nr:LysM peptidoglycan-binding domain-containing protein [Deltaproteobacteria bacterium]
MKGTGPLPDEGSARPEFIVKSFSSKYALLALCTAVLFLTLLWVQGTDAGEKTVLAPPETLHKQETSPRKPAIEPSDEDLPGIGPGTLQTEEYVVKEGDWIAKILREKGVLKDVSSLPQLLKVLRKLNTSLHDMNMIRPGEKIVVLVKVLPSEKGKDGSDEEAGPAPRKRLKTEAYRVKPGDILSRVVLSRYDISSKKFISEYLGLFKRCNPRVKDPDHIMVGQVIRLPLYPPEFEEALEGGRAFRDMDKTGGRVAVNLDRGKTVDVKPQTPEPKTPRAGKRPKPARGTPKARAVQEKIPLVAGDLGGIISQMGEEWIQSGEHFIPLKSSGQINLKAESYPIIRLDRGLTVIVDLHSALSDKMIRVIEASWSSYRVVRLSAGDDLGSALDKILRAFRYPRIFRKGEPIRLGGTIPVTITGDWILSSPRRSAARNRQFIVINLLKGRSKGTPVAIKDYLRPLGVEIIEYPQVEGVGDGPGTPPVVERAEGPETLIKSLLSLAGQEFTTGKRISAFESANNDFRFTVEADFYLEMGGKRRIIDLTGLDQEVIALLRDNGVTVLSLAGERDPLKMVARALRFLRVGFRPGPHQFLTNPGSKGRNVELTMKGIMFYSRNGESVFATPLNLPPELGAFLAQRGYRVLVLS